MADLPTFITTQDLSDRLGRDVTSDPGATSAVASACQICRNIAGQDFNFGTATIALDGTDTDALLLPQQPVGTVTAVTVDGGTITDYTVSEQGILFRGTASSWCWPVARWPRGRQNVRVTYTHGYQTFEVPSDVCEVALNLAMRAVVQGVEQSETVGDVTVEYGMSADDLTANELRILQRHRQVRSF